MTDPPPRLFLGPGNDRELREGPANQVNAGIANPPPQIQYPVHLTGTRFVMARLRDRRAITIDPAYYRTAERVPEPSLGTVVYQPSASTVADQPVLDFEQLADSLTEPEFRAQIPRSPGIKEGKRVKFADELPALDCSTCKCHQTDEAQNKVASRRVAVAEIPAEDPYSKYLLYPRPAPPSTQAAQTPMLSSSASSSNLRQPVPVRLTLPVTTYNPPPRLEIPKDDKKSAVTPSKKSNGRPPRVMKMDEMFLSGELFRAPETPEEEIEFAARPSPFRARPERDRRQSTPMFKRFGKQKVSTPPQKEDSSIQIKIRKDEQVALHLKTLHKNIDLSLLGQVLNTATDSNVTMPHNYSPLTFLPATPDPVCTSDWKMLQEAPGARFPEWNPFTDQEGSITSYPSEDLDDEYQMIPWNAF